MYCGLGDQAIYVLAKQDPLPLCFQCPYGTQFSQKTEDVKLIAQPGAVQ